MRWRHTIWVLVGMMVLAVCWRRLEEWRKAEVRSPKFEVRSPKSEVRSSKLGDSRARGGSVTRGRLTNTAKTVGELARSDRAVLLENAFFETSKPRALSADGRLLIPDALRAQGDPGSYIVQSRGPVGRRFRSLLEEAGARIVSYIPNNAYLVRASAVVAQQVEADPLTQAVLPYEPYYKLKAPLLEMALDEAGSGAGNDRQPAVTLRLLLFSDGSQGTVNEMGRFGAEVVGEDRSPFGPVYRVRVPGGRLCALANLAGVQAMELARERVPANDLSRAAIGVAADAVAPDNYLGLTGTNVLVNVNDTGVDASHPELAGRVLADLPSSGVDTNGHGTHVAGIIAGQGVQSATVTNAPGSMMPPVDFQFRGKAPGAGIFSVALSGSDAYLQETAARTNAFISNNGWTYGANQYDFAAASYDAAVRDALPTASGPQPIVFVFAAGNTGGGDGDGNGGTADGIESPATAKNVITVGAIEQFRQITSEVWECTTNDPVSCQTNRPWLALTDSGEQVAGFSSRGNVGIGVEGEGGRFKPDVVAPGAFVVSARSTQWDAAAYYNPTNSLGNFFEVLSNLNEGLGPYYRFESGTSMSAAEVAGTLALMQEFFEQRLGRTNSPALMKALLINGARSLTNYYDYRLGRGNNYQGWGLINLTNTLPTGLTNTGPGGAPMVFFDQNPADALATGQSHTRLLSVAEGAQGAPLRFTLVWTDPPGNPLAGVKLVNDLDLVVTNLDTGEVFYGNDILPGNSFNVPWDTNGPPNLDAVNNVENVFLAPALGTNYSVTVAGRRVNVNAASTNASEAVQDYALVISSGEGETGEALAVTDAPIVSEEAPLVTMLTNSFAGSVSDVGGMVLNQRVGANMPLLEGNTVSLPGQTNAQITIGTTNQWHFYVFTNETAFTNAAFLTFQPRVLSSSAGSGTNLSGPDIDLYVSMDAGLTNLDAAAISNAWMSVGRGGEETVVLSNATAGTYYVGVKSESGGGAEYGFLEIFSELPFAETDYQGNQLLRGFPPQALIPEGTPDRPGTAYVFCVASGSIPVHRVAVANFITHPVAEELLATLTHGNATVVLNRHSMSGEVLNRGTVYDDSDEGNIAGAQRTDGPGSLRDFAAKEGQGQWRLEMASTNQSGYNNQLWIWVERQPDLTAGNTATILPGACREDFLYVPQNATNMMVTTSLGSGTGAISVAVCPLGRSGWDCQGFGVDGVTTNGAVIINKTSNPPLNAGSYVVRQCNGGLEPATTDTRAMVTTTGRPPPRTRYMSSGPVPILDDAVTFSSINVTNPKTVVSVAVAVRLGHPRVSDLELHLISPTGVRVLLDENRGGAASDGMGLSLLSTNTDVVSSFDGSTAFTNIIETGLSSGTIQINYDFYSEADTLHVYYDGTLIADTGAHEDMGSTNVSYGPGASTQVKIVVDEGRPPTVWDYDVTYRRLDESFLTFTDNTNLTVTPFKFAVPPFTRHTYDPVTGAPLNGIYYLPEEPLEPLTGQTALGEWRLEIRDSRPGATDPEPMLVSWQLSFVFKDDLPLPLPLTSTDAATNTVAPGKIQYYAVDVPPWAAFATNQLMAATLPVNLLFNQAMLPTGTNSAPPDYLLVSGSTNASNTLAAASGSPRLAPGIPYFLGVQNTNATPVTFALGVAFDIIALTEGVPAPVAIPPGPLPRYYSLDVREGATGVSFQLLNLSGNANLVARKGLPLPNSADFDYASTFPGTNSEQIIIFTNSAPVALSPGRWYLGVLNADVTNVSGSILATEYANALPNIIPLTNAAPYAGTSGGGGNATDYYSFVVTTNAVRAQFEINHPTADMTLVARRGLPLPGLTDYDLISANHGTNDELIVVYDYSRPIKLSPGEWFLSAVNLSSEPAAYSIMATEFTAYGTNIVIDSSQVFSNEFCITWTSVAGIHYFVEGKTNYSGTNWTTISETITAGGPSTDWCLLLPSDYHFFRVGEGLALTPEAPPPAPFSIQTITWLTNQVLLTWTAPSSSVFSVEYTPTFAPPSWTTFSNVITSTNGSFSFMDDGTQSGGLGMTRYYRLVLSR